MNELRPPLRAMFNDSWPDDELPEIETWQCVKCEGHFVDPEEFCHASNECYKRRGYRIQPKLYWLGVNEPVCEDCAAESSIPPIDKE